jgi:hypothetical protein
VRWAADGVEAVLYSTRPVTEMPNLDDRSSRSCGVAVKALFSVIFILWRWLFTLLGGG